MNSIFIFAFIILLSILTIILFIAFKNIKVNNTNLNSKLKNYDDELSKLKHLNLELENNKKLLLSQQQSYLTSIDSLKLKLAKMEDEQEKSIAEFSQRQNNLDQMEHKLIIQQQEFNQMVNEEQKKITQKINELSDQREELNKREYEFRLKIDNFDKERDQKLLEIASMTQSEAEEKVLDKIRVDKRQEISKELDQFERNLKIEKKQLALDIILDSVQNIDCNQVQDHFNKIIKLPSDDYKGKLIGRDGRNINLLENLLGVNVIIDDTPGQITVASFNPVRRATAIVVIERLINSGKINQAEIEQTVEIVKREIYDMTIEKGKEAFQTLDIHDVDPFIIEKMGGLYFRTSYGQNVYYHSIEAGKIARNIASQLGLDVTLAARCALLHDLGKIDSEETGISHVQLGAMYAQNNGECHEVINTILSHHGDEEPDNIYAVIAQIADGLSASQLGSRFDSYATFIQRVESLEKVALNRSGVKKAYALKGGKELRIIVESSSVKDSELKALAQEIRDDVKKEVTIPGGITINVLRENRYILNVKNIENEMLRNDEQGN